MPKEKKSPTPQLGLPKSDRQHFTYSENKLLDQITTEVMEAWKKDLLTIRKTHQECNKLIESMKHLRIEIKENYSMQIEIAENLNKINNKRWWHKFFKPKT